MRVGIVEAAKLTGLSKYNLRKGAIEGRYPVMRVSTDKSKLIFDLDLLEESIRNQALGNMKRTKRLENKNDEKLPVFTENNVEQVKSNNSELTKPLEEG